MRIPGWYFFTIAVTFHLSMLLFAHFKGTPMYLVFIPLPLAAWGLWVLHRPDSDRKLDDNAKALLLLWTDERVVRSCVSVRNDLELLIEYPTSIADSIEKLLRPSMGEVVHALADHPDLMEGVRVELQMALGDCQVCVERVWTALADGASDEARSSLLLAHTAAIRMCAIAER